MVIKVDRAEWFIAEGKVLITDYPGDKYQKKVKKMIKLNYPKYWCATSKTI